MESYCKGSNTPECVELLNNVRDCKRAGGQSMNECVDLARERYVRRIPPFDELVYPWRNFDWDYTRYIDNNYNSDETGATSKGNFPAIFKNPRALFRLMKGFTVDPNPAPNSISTISDVTICSKIAPSERASCEVMNRIRRSYLGQKKPNGLSGRFGNNRLNGESSSSYYYKWGSCVTKDKNPIVCKRKGYQYIGGKCFKPRYHFIRNEPGMDFSKLRMNLPTNTKDEKFNKFARGTNTATDLMAKTANAATGGMKGSIPSTINDMISFNPFQQLAVYNGTDMGDYEVEQCPNEHFTSEVREHMNYNETDSWFRWIFAIMLLGTIIVFLVWIFRRGIKEYKGVFRLK